MSGWQERARAFDLTATKAEYWHRGCNCGSDALASLYGTHLEPAGLRAVRAPSVNVLRLVADGCDGPGTERRIYEALSARKSVL